MTWSHTSRRPQGQLWGDQDINEILMAKRMIFTTREAVFQPCGRELWLVVGGGFHHGMSIMSVTRSLVWGLVKYLFFSFADVYLKIATIFPASPNTQATPRSFFHSSIQPWWWDDARPYAYTPTTQQHAPLLTYRVHRGISRNNMQCIRYSDRQVFCNKMQYIYFSDRQVFIHYIIESKLWRWYLEHSQHCTDWIRTILRGRIRECITITSILQNDRRHVVYIYRVCSNWVH